MALGDSDEVFGGFFGLKDWIWWIFVAGTSILILAIFSYFTCCSRARRTSGRPMRDRRPNAQYARRLADQSNDCNAVVEPSTRSNPESYSRSNASHGFVFPVAPNDQAPFQRGHSNRTISISGLEGRTSFLPILEDRIGKRESHSLTRVTQLDSSNTFYSSQYSDDSHFSPISSPPNTSDPASKRKSARSSSKLSLLGNVHCGLTTTLGDRISTLRAAYFNGTHSTCPTEFSRSGSRSFDEELKAVKELTSSRTKALELLLEEVSDFESKQQSGSTATPSPAIGDFTNTVNGNRKQHPTNVEAELITVVSSYDEDLDHFDIIL